VILLNISLTIVLIVIVASAVSLASCGQDSEEQVAAHIANSAELRQIDETCASFAKPESFRQVKKGISGNSEIAIIFYQYVSPLSFDEVAAFYREREKQEKYRIIREDNRQAERSINNIHFQVEGLSIVLENRPPYGIFSVDCIK
jgi:hypothetical protein